MKFFDTVVTHSTIFHADDVFGVAMCTLINPSIRVVRTLDFEEFVDDPNTLIFDIGMGKYDHHQEDKALRPDGVPYCGFGLLWRDFGELLCPDHEAWQRVDETLVYPIDQADNGVKQNLLSQSIKLLNPFWDSRETEDEAFSEALWIARKLLKAKIDDANATIRARSAVIAHYFGGKVLVLDQYLPWSDSVHNDERLKDVVFVVYPSQRGGWNVQTVPKVPGQFVNRMDFPEDWLGHADPDRGITFSHTANFLISCETKEQAVAVANEAVELGEETATVVYSI